MSIVALCSAHGAPGVTTSALAMAWAWTNARPGRRALLVDADPAGSGLLTRALADAAPTHAGVLALAAQRPPHDLERVMHCCLALDPHATCMVLPGIADPVQARPLAGLWPALLDTARGLSDVGVDVLVDAGRVGHRHEPTTWLDESDLVAVVVRGDVASVAPAAAAVRVIGERRGGARGVVGLAVDPGGYPPRDIATALGIDTVLSLVRDEWAAQALASGAAAGRRFDRSPLMRAARDAALRIGELVPERSEVAP